MTLCEPVFVYGAGGHAKVVIDILEQQQVPIAAVLDDNEALRGKTILGYAIQHTVEVIDDLPSQGIRRSVVAIGDNRVRELQAASLMQKGFELVTCIHPSAVISRHAQVCAGVVVMAGVMVNPAAVIRDFAILNTGCTIDHDCDIGIAVHVGPGVHVGGTVQIGDRTLIGTGASIKHNCRIGHDVIVGAGAAVIGDLPSQVTAVGVPARVIHD